jgi:hypothetical protein
MRSRICIWFTVHRLKLPVSQVWVRQPRVAIIALTTFAVRPPVTGMSYIGHQRMNA